MACSALTNYFDTSNSNAEFYKCVSEKLDDKSSKRPKYWQHFVTSSHMRGTKLMVYPDAAADVDLVSTSDFKKITEANPNCKEPDKQTETDDLRPKW